MKKRVILTTAVAFVLLLAVIAAGLNAVFTVTYVKADFVTCSSEGGDEAEKLQKQLDEFVGKSTTFLDLDEVRGVVEKYPCFRIGTLEKKFPNTISLTVYERSETFAFALDGGGFAVLDENGRYLYEKEENVNRTGGRNVLLEGFGLEITAEGYALGNAFDGFLALYAVFAEQLSDPRANMETVSFGTEGSNFSYFSIRMREGYLIKIYDPDSRIEDKAAKSLEEYLSVSDGERIYGRITVLERRDGEIVADPV